MSAPVTPYDRPRNRVSNTVFKSGPLFISSKGLGWKSWKKRWFILTRTSLVFFKNDPSALPQKGGEVNLTLGGIDLNNSGSVIVREDKKLLTVLFPDGRDGRAFTLKAETLEDLFEWKTALEHALAQAPNAALVMGQNGIFRNDSADAIEGSGEHWRDRRPVKSLVVGRPILLALEDIDGSPSFLEKALCFIEQYGVKVEGILRQSADVDEVDHRVHEYEQGRNQFSPDEDAHVVGDCIKHVLRELPSSPVPAPCCTALLEAHRMEGKEARIAAMRLAVAETFPEPNRRLLQRVLKMMHAVASYTKENRMTASAVAACMAPLLLRPLLAGECELEDESDRSGDNAAQLLAAAAAANNAQAIVTTLLEEYDSIFVDDQTQQNPASPEMYTQIEDSGSEGSTDDEVLQIREDGFHDAQNDLEAELEDDPERVLSGTLSESSGNAGSDLYDYKVFEGGDSDVEYPGDMEHLATKQKVSKDSYPQPEQLAGEQGGIYVEGGNDENQGSPPNGSRLPPWGNGASSPSSPKHVLSTPGPGISNGKAVNKSNGSVSAIKRPSIWNRNTVNKKNQCSEPADSSEEERVIQRLEMTKNELRNKIAKEAKGNAILQASLERRKQALHEKNICITASEVSDKKLHIVYMGGIQDKGDSRTEHHEMLEFVHGSHKAAEESLKYSYGKSFSGFAAMLSPSHVQQLSNMDGVISVFESKKRQLLTTRSWDFIGFPLSGQSKHLDYESDIIIGVLDTGIWPESESFNDAGFGPVPSKWRGVCQTTSDFTSCNKKIIGARYYQLSFDIPADEDYLSPRDGNGHGTHTSSTAAGNLVKNASVYGIAQGDARGGVPGARIAMYKVCWGPSGGCEDADILAAFDDAIYDGVDVISVSLGGFDGDYFEDSVAIGAFHSMKRGILTSNACGNDGPSKESISNYSPWSLTVAASTIDRKIESQLLLGNIMTFEGIALNTFIMEQFIYPLIYGGYAINTSGGFTYEDSRSCVANSLDATKVKGKIVLCYQGSEDNPDQTVFLSGGEGIIILDDYFDETSYPYLVPATLLNTTQGDIIISYINSTSSPVAKIFKSTTSRELAPIVASFSSRGPNPITKNILKPDITAPGVNILAAWSEHSSITELPGETRFPEFNIISGTSMACPHATGAAGFVKSYHPEWSPAAIKSALMTTAYIMDASLPHNGDAEFGYGSGQINPAKAINPGLVYDTDVNDYIKMLCTQGYNDTTLRLLTADFSSCDFVEAFKYGALELNYPSIMVVANPGKYVYAKFSRIVTNVGPSQSTYKVITNTPSGIKVTVSPDTLSFSTVNQKLAYNVTIEGGVIPSNTLLSGSLTWIYGNYTVRSPIGVYCQLS